MPDAPQSYGAKLALPELAAVIRQGVKAARDAAGSLPWSEFEIVVARVLTANEARAEATAEMVYEAYPRHVGRKAALLAIKRAAKDDSKGTLNTARGHGAFTFEHLLERARAYAEAVTKWPERDRPFIPHPATWFNQGRYLDDPKEWQRGSSTPAAPRTYKEI